MLLLESCIESGLPWLNKYVNPTTMYLNWGCSDPCLCIRSKIRYSLGMLFATYLLQYLKHSLQYQCSMLPKHGSTLSDMIHNVDWYMCWQLQTDKSPMHNIWLTMNNHLIVEDFSCCRTVQIIVLNMPRTVGKHQTLYQWNETNKNRLLETVTTSAAVKILPWQLKISAKNFLPTALPTNYN